MWRDEPDPPAGRGVARTGVTAIVPGGGPLGALRAPLPAGVAVLNGAGELTSAVQVAEWGLLETPILLTSTMQVGRAWDSLVELLCDLDPTLGADRVVIPMVGECDDSWLNDARRMQITAADVRAAVKGAATGPVSRGRGRRRHRDGLLRVEGRHRHGLPPGGDAGATVGVLLLTNFGSAERLTVDGVPVGRSLRPPPEPTTAPDRGRELHRDRGHGRALQLAASSSAWPAGSGWGWPAAARWPRTAAARSSPPSAPCRPPASAPIDDGDLNGCSRPSWRRPRRRSSTA